MHQDDKQKAYKKLGGAKISEVSFRGTVQPDDKNSKTTKEKLVNNC
jgi:hypothetical protein